MDEELRDLEQTGQKIIDMYKKTFHFAGVLSETTVNVFKLPKKKIREHHQNEMEKARYRQFKQEKKQMKLKSFGDSFSEQNKQIISNALENKVKGFTFTGQYTDLCYFSKSDTMPISAIVNIQDQQIKQAVINNFDKAIAAGQLEIKDGYLNITDKGKRIINNNAFQSQAKTDQLQAYNLSATKAITENLKNGEVQMCVGLTGNYKNDFTVFNYTDKINLTEILNYPDRDLSQKVLSNVKQWADKGAVKIENGIAKITPEGKQMLNMSEFKAVVKPVSEKKIGSFDTTNKIIVTTKKVSGEVKKEVKIAKQAVKLKK